MDVSVFLLWVLVTSFMDHFAHNLRNHLIHQHIIQHLNFRQATKYNLIYVGNIKQGDKIKYSLEWFQVISIKSKFKFTWSFQQLNFLMHISAESFLGNILQIQHHITIMCWVLHIFSSHSPTILRAVSVHEQQMIWVLSLIKPKRPSHF